MFIAVVLAVVLAAGMTAFEMLITPKGKKAPQTVVQLIGEVEAQSEASGGEFPLNVLPGDARLKSRRGMRSVDDVNQRVLLKNRSKDEQSPLTENDLVLLQRLRENLVDFRYPTKHRVETLRLPDFYFASSRARNARKPARKFKHLSRVYSRLFVEKEPVHITVLGGSNTAGTGLGKGANDTQSAHHQSYAVAFERWLNKVYPPKHGSHVVHNFGRGAVGSCYFQLLIEKLADPSYLGAQTDLFVLETSVNDVLSNDMACFGQLLSKITAAFPNSSIISLHLTSTTDFLNSCTIEPLSLSYCKEDIDLAGTNISLSPQHLRHIARWCAKSKTIAKYDILQVDLEMLLYMICRGIPPFQHAYFTSELVIFAPEVKRQDQVRRCGRAKERLLSYISQQNSKKLLTELPLLTWGTYNNTKAYDPGTVNAYRAPFVPIENLIASKVGQARGVSEALGNLFLFTDRVHIGRWGHMLVAAELAIWTTWLETVGYDGIVKEERKQTVVRNKTIWAATTFDVKFYHGHTRGRVTRLNMHKPADKNAKLDINPLRATEKAQGWRIGDDSAMHKEGYLTKDVVSRNISFKLPRFEASASDLFVVRLGYMKSYAPIMGNFSVDVYDTLSGTRSQTNLTGYHNDRVSVFVDDVVGVVNGTNQIVLTVTSLPKGKAVKVKIIAIYVTQAGAPTT